MLSSSSQASFAERAKSQLGKQPPKLSPHRLDIDQMRRPRDCTNPFGSSPVAEVSGHSHH